MGPLMMLSNILAPATFAAGASYLGHRWFRGQAEKAEQSFQDALIRDASGLLCQHLPDSRDRYAEAIRDAVEYGRPRPELDRLIRVECEFARTNRADIYRRTLAVLILDGEEVVAAELTRDVPRELIPAQVREAFIRSGTAAQGFLLYDRQPAPEN